ncbi:MAG TPA: hypothetical protein VJV74_01770 [Terriglobia bacterium]|nr:hypothetical protein [Terriglobia bacterium]
MRWHSPIGISDERNAKPLIVPRTGTRARAKHLFRLKRRDHRCHLAAFHPLELPVELDLLHATLRRWRAMLR